jgi:hypothetical protein
MELYLQGLDEINKHTHTHTHSEMDEESRDQTTLSRFVLDELDKFRAVDIGTL